MALGTIRTPVLLSAIPTLTDERGVVLMIEGDLDRERHQSKTRRGTEPLEDGTEITDHAVAAPRKLSLKGTISNLRGAQNAVEAWQQLLGVQAVGETVRVTTQFESYDEMLIDDLIGDRRGHAVTVTLELGEVVRVADAVYVPPPPVPSRTSVAAASGRIFPEDFARLEILGIGLGKIRSAKGAAFAASAVAAQGIPVGRQGRARAPYRYSVPEWRARKQADAEARKRVDAQRRRAYRNLLVSQGTPRSQAGILAANADPAEVERSTVIVRGRGPVVARGRVPVTVPPTRANRPR